VVVNYLRLLWSGVRPYEADAPLVIDPDAVLTDAIAFQSFEPISGRNPQVIERSSGSQLAKLPQRRRMDPRIYGRHALTAPQSLGVFAPERPDHTTII